ncbi:hypothetical protein [Poseidonocella sp. HB161398]|uniref:hypothetical protein n=1 Tax=Poseidonocella sp. HB161398 TaxID=2320855 RepID=UPI001107B87A|nr:hypothetical protein [Poseidonocella sp. HB161398]
MTYLVPLAATLLAFLPALFSTRRSGVFGITPDPATTALLATFGLIVSAVSWITWAAIMVAFSLEATCK